MDNSDDKAMLPVHLILGASEYLSCASRLRSVLKLEKQGSQFQRKLNWDGLYWWAEQRILNLQPCCLLKQESTITKIYAGWMC